MNKRKFLEKLQNSQKNISYNDFVTLVKAYGFSKVGGEGSHAVYKHPIEKATINIQNAKGQAKPYQIKQFLAIVELHNLRLNREDD